MTCTCLVPYLLQSECVCLWLAVLPQVEAAEEGLGQGAMAALTKQSELCMQLHAPGKHWLHREEGRCAWRKEGDREERREEGGLKKMLS